MFKKNFKNNLLSTIIFFALALLVDASVSYAAPSGGHHDNSVWSLKLFFINFFIYLVLIGILIKKAVPPAWASRRERVRSQLEESRSKMLVSERNLSEARGKLAGIESEIRRIEESAKQEAQVEAQEIADNARRSAERIITQARDSVAAERKFAQGVLRRMYAEMAIKMAEEKLRAQMTSEKDRSLRERVQQNIGQLIH